MTKKITKAFKKLIRGYIPYGFSKMFHPKSPKLAYYRYIMDHGDAHHLFLFGYEYDDFNVQIYEDKTNGLPYVMLPHSTKRLYFKRGMSEGKIAKLFKSLIMEQDPRSPHRYFDSIQEFKGKVLLDIGSAEGILSLMAIEQVEHVFLFECDEYWKEALQKTFEPWKDKITIVPKYVGNQDDETTIKLDTFFQDEPVSNLFLKMDIEGMEREALVGAKQLFSKKGNVSFAVCTYHRRDDLKVIHSFLDHYKCSYTNQKAYWSHRMKSVMLRGHN
ncbi:MAG: FkbM family methyltransferase [Prevotella sp.]|jgi:hypothetical protein|nr:FkbM family methyltransferase [Prevotella sp.]MCI2081484.1 FkbM family methyltransferase [Prevotella sp.]MCI2103346.1 FkbM family methyltransferase [Prevotella sp.]